jgi:LamB/YcsF family
MPINLSLFVRQPHGALYFYMMRNPAVADAVARVAALFSVPLFGFPHSAHAEAAARHGVPFLPELYVDINYSDDSPPALLPVGPVGQGQPPTVDEISKKITMCARSNQSASHTRWRGRWYFVFTDEGPVRICQPCLLAARPSVYLSTQSHLAYVFTVILRQPCRTS